MNTFFLKYLNFFFFYFLVFAYSNLFAQELPPVHNFSSNDYNAENQNWGISQSDENYIYVANGSGLLEYNGANWKLYPSPNNTVIRSVNVINNKVYTGSYMDFGFWEKNEFGNLEYHSLINILEKPLIEDEQFWNILEFDEFVLFQSLNRLYVFNTNDKSFQIINSTSTRAEVFKVGNNVYFQKINEGIFKIEKGEAVLISDHEILKNNDVVGIFLVDGKLLFLTHYGSFYFLENGNFTKWRIPANKVLDSKSIYCSKQLRDGSFVLGTISEGMYQISEKGEFMMLIDQNNGLINNTVLSVFQDAEHNLWLGLDSGISIVNLKSPFSVFKDLSGKVGSVYASVLFNNHLYVGTNQGLFYKKYNSQNEFTFIENTKGQVWCLEVIDNELFCGHNGGTFLIDKNRAVQISNYPGTWNINRIKNFDNLLLQGNYNGLSVLEKKNNQWVFRNKVEGFDISSRYTEFINENELFVSHGYKGTYKIKLNEEFTRVLGIQNEKTAPVAPKSSLIKYNNELYYFINTGLFKYNNEKLQFVKDSSLTDALLKEDEYYSGKLVAEELSNTLWGFTKEKIVFFTPSEFNKNLKVQKIAFPASFRNSVIGNETVVALNNELYLFGTANGYVLLNTNKLEQKKYHININSIEISQVDAKKSLVSLSDSEPVFSSSQNNLNFKFSIPEYDNFIEVRYQYKLEGIYEKWSEWSGESEVAFKNLPYGKYNFKVRAKCSDKITENVANYTFNINRPWYLSNEMIAVYVVIGMFLFLIIHMVYKKYYKKQQQELVDKKQREFALSKLESDKVIMKLRNDKLMNEISSKSRELTSSTMGLIKKNELLNTIKKELTNLKEGTKIGPVIKIINNSLVDNNDWEMFQEAFNNTDTDFLKKVKNIHPALTPNDLKLCVYLRLNLSSKEIAPLLNISPRSVEIKRYRLRKKMDLQHKKSLVEYILEI